MFDKKWIIGFAAMVVCGVGQSQGAIIHESATLSVGRSTTAAFASLLISELAICR